MSSLTLNTFLVLKGVKVVSKNECYEWLIARLYFTSDTKIKMLIKIIIKQEKKMFNSLFNKKKNMIYESIYSIKRFLLWTCVYHKQNIETFDDASVCQLLLLR